MLNPGFIRGHNNFPSATKLESTPLHTAGCLPVASRGSYPVPSHLNNLRLQFQLSSKTHKIDVQQSLTRAHSSLLNFVPRVRKSIAPICIYLHVANGLKIAARNNLRLGIKCLILERREADLGEKYGARKRRSPARGIRGASGNIIPS